MFFGERECVIIRNIELSLGKIRRAVAIVVFVERQQTVLAVTFDVTDEVRQTKNDLLISLFNIGHGAGAEIDLELETMKWMKPGKHLRINESAAAAFAEAGHVRVIVQKARGI